MPASVRMINLHIWRKVRTIALDPKLSFWYTLSACVYIYFIVCERDDMAYVELIFVVVEHQVSEPEMRLAWTVSKLPRRSTYLRMT